MRAPCFSRPRPRAAEQLGPFEWTGVERLVAIGDVHGSYEKLLVLLEGTGLVDSDLAWVGSESHVVFLGDLIDRGERDREVLDLLRRLESEAEAVGGRVHLLLGNHEALNIAGDLRFVEGQGFSDFIAEEPGGDRSAALSRFRSAALEVGMPSAKIQPAFYEDHPEGFFGRLHAFSPDGDYGGWLLEKPAVIKINGYVFLHGGLDDSVATLGLGGINRGVRESLILFNDHRRVVGEGRLLTYRETRDNAEKMVRSRSPTPF